MDQATNPCRAVRKATIDGIVAGLARVQGPNCTASRSLATPATNPCGAVPYFRSRSLAHQNIKPSKYKLAAQASASTTRKMHSLAHRARISATSKLTHQLTDHFSLKSQKKTANERQQMPADAFYTSIAFINVHSRLHSPQTLVRSCPLKTPDGEPEVTRRGH